jgi:hypothetical protein
LVSKPHKKIDFGRRSSFPYVLIHG